MRIEKKTWKELFEKVLSGEKTFDLRLNDFEAKEGDILVMKEWDEQTQKYTGRVIEKEITFVLKTKDLNFWTDEEVEKKGFLVMAFK